MRTLLILLMSAWLTAGCSTLVATGDGAQNRLAVQYATLKVLESGEVDPARLRELVQTAEAYVGEGVDVTVARLAEDARARLAESGLPPADLLLVGAILQTAESRIKERLGPGPLSDTQRVSLLTLLSWVEEAAWSI